MASRGRKGAQRKANVKTTPTVQMTEEQYNASRQAIVERYQARLLKGIQKLFKPDKLTDVVLVAEGQTIPCHKVMLAAASEYFRDKFIAKAAELKDPGRLEMENMDFLTLKIVIHYIYSGYINTSGCYRSLILAGRLLKLPRLAAICEQQLIQTIDKSNCVSIHAFAKEHELPDTGTKAMETMLDCFSDVVNSEEFKEMEVASLLEYLSDDRLNVPIEDPVFEAVMLWVKHDQQARTQHLAALLDQVRLAWCSVDFLQNVVAQEPLMATLACQTTEPLQNTEKASS